MIKKAKDISIIVPTYNEVNNVETLVRRIHDACKKSRINEEIIFVDDDSPDGTADRALSLSKAFPVRVIRRRGKRGLSSAVIDGFKAGESDILGVIDADLSHPPEIIPDLRSMIYERNKDIAIGSRYIKGGGVEEWTLIRKLISRSATLLARPLTKVKDPMSGYFFLKKDILQGVRLKPRGYKILLEILAKCKYSSAGEYPYIFRNRKVGTSKLGSKTILHYLKQIFDLYIYRLTR